MLAPQTTAPDFSTEDIYGNRVQLKNFLGKRLLIIFYRYAGCPFCNLHFHTLQKHATDLQKNGFQIITFFQSTKENILAKPAQKKPSFSVIADPEKKYYSLYQVESSLAGAVRSLTELPQLIKASSLYGQGKVEGDLLLMPAEVFINERLEIVKIHYGTSMNDFSSFIDIEKFANFG